MVGHNHKFIQPDMWKMFRNCLPTKSCDFPNVRQFNFAIHDIPQQTLPILHTNGNKISPGLGIIITLQTNGFAVVDFGIVFHMVCLICLCTHGVTQRNSYTSPPATVPRYGWLTTCPSFITK